MNRAFSWAVLLAFVLLAIAVGPAPWVDDVYAGTYTFKFAHAQPDTHPAQVNDLLQGATGVDFQRADQGRALRRGGPRKEPELMDMVKIGNIQGTRGALFERANKKYLLYTLPFLFAISSRQELIRSDFGRRSTRDESQRLLRARHGRGGRLPAVHQQRPPLASPDDMKGLKMRTPPIDSIIRTMNALGANPQQVPYGETYMALKTNVVDGQENPCSNIAEMKFFEVQKYFTEVNYQIHPDPFFVSLTWYDALPNDLKTVFSSAARAAMARSDDVWLASEKDYQALLTQKLKANKITAENHKAFVAKVKPVWDHYVSAGFFTRPKSTRRWRRLAGS